MKQDLTYKNGKAKEFLYWAWNHSLIVGVAMIVLCILYFFVGVKITLDVQEQGVINFAQSVCGDGKIDSIRQWSKASHDNYGAIPVSYSIVCTEKQYGIHEMYYFYLVPDWVVQDENGNLQEEKTVMWGRGVIQ